MHKIKEKIIRLYTEIFFLQIFAHEYRFPSSSPQKKSLKIWQKSGPHI